MLKIVNGYFFPHSYSAVAVAASAAAAAAAVGGGGDGDDDGDSVTLLIFYLLENLHLYQIVSGITLIQGKEILPIPR